TEREVHFTVLAGAGDAVETISAWTRGVSTTSGSARPEAITRRASAAATTTIHVKMRFTAHPPAELRGLDGREAPGLRAHEAREGPVLLDVLRRLRTVHERAGRVVHGVVHERGGAGDRHPVLAAPLPRLAS